MTAQPTPSTAPRRALAVLAALAAAACAPLPSQTPAPEAAAEAAPMATACPKDIAAIARCLAGQDSAGAYYLIAMPQA